MAARAREGMAQLVDKRILGDTTTHAPALASHLGRLFLAWKGAGNDNLNLMFSADDGRTFVGKVTVPDASTHGPALASGPTGLWVAWKGSGNDNLNVARAQLIGNTAGAFGIEPKLGDKTVVAQLSPVAPALAVHQDERMLSWKGLGNDHLNVMRGGASGPFGGPSIFFEDFSDRTPAVAVHNGSLFIAWKGSGNQNLNVARVPIGTTGVGVSLVDKRILGDTTEQGPALASHNGRLCLAWKGAGNDDLNVLTSSDGLSFGGKTTFGDASDSQPALAPHRGRLFMAWKGSGNQNLNVAELRD